MKSGGDTWQQSDRLPPAREPCKNDREEREYDLALSNPNRCFGKGIAEDPLVVWIDRPDYLNRDLMWAHNNFAKAIAKVLGLTHTWIIKVAHNCQYARDAEGRKILIEEPDRWLLKEADMHITLRLGTDLYECRLAAHAYVMLDGNGNPEKYMSDMVRRFKTESDNDEQLVFWPWRNGRRRFLPRRPINLGDNWEAHANVGPYLDTYRPNRRRTCDTYTPRNDSTPQRETFPSKSKIFEGVRTPELNALVKRCHATYDVYRELHEKLAVMENPPTDQLRELHAIRERVSTMQREVYREAMGFVM